MYVRVCAHTGTCVRALGAASSYQVGVVSCTCISSPRLPNASLPSLICTRKATGANRGTFNCRKKRLASRDENGH